MIDERTISQDEVWEEHLQDVHVPQHWAYMFGVLVGGFVVMLILMALLDAAT